MKEGRKPEYTEKTPGDELQKMPHTKAQRFKPQARHSNPHNSIGGRLGNQTCEPLHHSSPPVVVIIFQKRHWREKNLPKKAILLI